MQRAHGCPQIPEVLFSTGQCVVFSSRQPEKLEQLGRQLIGLEPNGALGHWLVGLALEERWRDVAHPPHRRVQTRSRSEPRDLRSLCALSHAYGLVGNKAQAFETASRYIDLHTNTITRYTLSFRQPARRCSSTGMGAQG